MTGTPIKVVAFNGSARNGGNTAILLKYVLKELENEGIETELMEMSGQKIHGCLACRECSKRKDRRCGQTGDMGNEYIEKMEQADGILLGSPTCMLPT
jgi:multimeric flavodoxin WrbA